MTLNLENYRSSTEYREILRILQKASTHPENFLWQSFGLKKHIVPIHHFEIDFVSREVVALYSSHHHQIQHDLPLFVKLDYRTSVFKVSHFLTRVDSVHFNFPDHIKTQEMRKEPRWALPTELERLVQLRPSVSGSTQDLFAHLEARVYDYSASGLGLIVPEEKRSFLKNNRILWLTHLHHLPLTNPLLAEVVYLGQDTQDSIKGKKSKDLKLGLKLSGNLKSVILNGLE